VHGFTFYIALYNKVGYFNANLQEVCIFYKVEMNCGRLDNYSVSEMKGFGVVLYVGKPTIGT